MSSIADVFMVSFEKMEGIRCCGFSIITMAIRDRISAISPSIAYGRHTPADITSQARRHLGAPGFAAKSVSDAQNLQGSSQKALE